MLRLINKDHSPPDFFRYRHAETGWLSKAVDHYNWILEIVGHRRGNSLPPITVADAENQLCQTLPPGWCEHDDGERSGRSWVNTRLNWSQIVEGTKAYVDLILSGFKTVEQEEANRRASICASCYLKTPPQGCGSCLKIAQLIVGDVAAKTTPHDSYLVNQACSVCSCPVKSIVHFPLSALDKADSPEKQEAFPTFCWRKQGSPNRVESNL